jgi:hypothetical protein
MSRNLKIRKYPSALDPNDTIVQYKTLTEKMLTSQTLS